VQVLIVDDRAVSRRQIADELRERGYGTLEAADGLEAIGAFERRRPDAVITDMRMPHADGFELLEQIRARADVPVFCVTAYPEWDAALLAMKQGAAYYYRWPRDFERLIDDVDRVLAGEAEAQGPEPGSLEEIRHAGRRRTAAERKLLVEKALQRTRGNVGRAADLLGISRRTIYHWMERYGVER
jgi:DNA-binding NtrC family response regulator